MLSSGVRMTLEIVRHDRRADRNRELSEEKGALMASLRRYDISVSELLMVEFALQPSNADTHWKMRCRFLEQFRLCRNTNECESHHWSAKRVQVICAGRMHG